MSKIIKGTTNSFSTTSYGTLNLAVDAAGADNSIIHVDQNETIDGNLTVPSNITLSFEPEYKLTIASGKTLTINGSIKASHFQIFDISSGGIVNGQTKVSMVLPEWFGATSGTDLATGNSNPVPLQAAINFAQQIKTASSDQRGAPLDLSWGTFRFNTQLIFPDDVSVRNGTLLASVSSGICMLAQPVNETYASPYFTNLTIQKLQYSPEAGLKIVDGYAHSLENCTFNNWQGSIALDLRGCQIGEHNSCKFVDNGVHLYVSTNDSGLISTDLSFTNNRFSRSFELTDASIVIDSGIDAKGAERITFDNCGFENTYRGEAIHFVNSRYSLVNNSRFEGVGILGDGDLSFIRLKQIGTGVEPYLNRVTNCTFSNPHTTATGEYPPIVVNQTGSENLRLFNNLFPLSSPSISDSGINTFALGNTTLENHLTYDNLETTTSGVFILQNRTESTAVTTRQNSPGFLFKSSAWDSDNSISREEEWIMLVSPSTGTTVRSTFQLSRRQDGGSWNTHLSVDSLGQIIASSAVVAGSGPSMNYADRNTGLGTTVNFYNVSRDAPIVLGHYNRTDAAENIVIASCYDRDAASITNAATMRLHSFGWTDNTDTYNEMAYVRADGEVVASGIQAASEDVEVIASDKGIIMKSPDGTRYRVTMLNGGTLDVNAV